VLVEAGAASGREPSEIVELRSYLSQFLKEKGQSLSAEDEGPFPFRLLHFRRTFVEKIFQNFLVEGEILTSEPGASGCWRPRIRAWARSSRVAFNQSRFPGWSDLSSIVTTMYRARFSWVSTLWTWNFQVRGVVSVLPCLPRFPLAPLLGSRAAISVIWVAIWAIWLRVNSQLFARGRFRYSIKTSGLEHFPVALDSGSNARQHPVSSLRREAIGASSGSR
jgi:hypothetical protein